MPAEAITSHPAVLTSSLLARIAGSQILLNLTTADFRVKPEGRLWPRPAVTILTRCQNYVFYGRLLFLPGARPECGMRAGDGMEEVIRTIRLMVDLCGKRMRLPWQ